MARITEKMRVRTLLEDYPDAEETLSWYGIELKESDMPLTLSVLCEENDVDFGEVKLDLADVSEDYDPRFDSDSLEDDDEDEYDEYDEDEDEDEENEDEYGDDEGDEYDDLDETLDDGLNGTIDEDDEFGVDAEDTPGLLPTGQHLSKATGTGWRGKSSK